MRNLLIATTGFLVGAALMTAVAVALPRTMTVTAKQSSPLAAMPMGGTTGMMGSTVSAAASRKLTIQHVLKGCHVWSNGKTTSPTMRLSLGPGGRLSILNRDIDAHQLLQLSGPTKLHLAGPMMMNHGTTIAFAKRGIYRLQTKTVEMPGGMEAETVGPDNTLRLVVTVA